MDPLLAGQRNLSSMDHAGIYGMTEYANITYPYSGLWLRKPVSLISVERLLVTCTVRNMTPETLFHLQRIAQITVREWLRPL